MLKTYQNLNEHFYRYAISFSLYFGENCLTNCHCSANPFFWPVDFLFNAFNFFILHHCDIIMGTIAFQITSLTIVYSTVYSDADQRKHQSSASLPFVWGIHRSPVNSPHKWPVTWKIFSFDDVIMKFSPLGSGNQQPQCQPSPLIRIMPPRIPVD